MKTRKTVPMEFRADSEENTRKVFETYVEIIEEIDIHASERMAELNRKNAMANLPSSMR